MTVPVIRRFSGRPATLNTPVEMTDAETNEKFFTLAQANAILDVVNQPDPASGARYKVSIKKSGNETPVRLYSDTMSPSSAGRIAVGPISLSAGQYQLIVQQTSGTPAEYAIAVKFDHPIG